MRLLPLEIWVLVLGASVRIVDALAFTVDSWEGITVGVPFMITWKDAVGTVRLMMSCGDSTNPGNPMWYRNETDAEFYSWYPFIQIGYALNQTYYFSVTQADFTEAFGQSFTISNNTSTGTANTGGSSTSTARLSVSMAVDIASSTTTTGTDSGQTTTGASPGQTTSSSLISTSASATGTAAEQTATNTGSSNSKTGSTSPTQTNHPSSSSSNDASTSTTTTVLNATGTGLSPTLKIVVGICAGIGGLLMCLAIGLAFWWRRRYIKALKTAEIRGTGWKAELDGVDTERGRGSWLGGRGRVRRWSRRVVGAGGGNWGATWGGVIPTEKREGGDGPSGGGRSARAVERRSGRAELQGEEIAGELTVAGADEERRTRTGETSELNGEEVVRHELPGEA